MVRRQLPARRLQRRRRPELQPLRPARQRRRHAAARSERLEFGRRCGRQPVGRERWHEHRRLDRGTVQRQHAGRHPPVHRTHQPLRHHPVDPRSRHRRADDQDGRRRRHHARGDGRRSRPQRSAHQRMHGAAELRLHAVPQGRRAQGHAHRHSSRRLLRGTDVPRAGPAVRGSQARRDGRDGSGNHGTQGPQVPRSSIPPTCRA